ncbi:MAG: type II toxin-antitoxin system VapC family toxin [Aestuariivirga sp.]
MMTVVLDASALIALLKNEPGAEMVAQALSDTKITAVNYAEVISHFVHAGMPATEVDAMLCPLPLVIVPADENLARLAGHLRAQTASAGLSLGDRFCIALAKIDKLPAWTADRQWQSIAASVDVKITIIR